MPKLTRHSARIVAVSAAALVLSPVPGQQAVEAAGWLAPKQRLQTAEPPAIVLAGSSNFETGRMPTAPPRGHSPRVRGGGILLVPGILAVPQLLNQGADTKSTGKSDRSQEKTTASISCTGGRVSRGQCVCPSSKTREAVGRNAFVCKDGTSSTTATSTSPQSCIGGVKRKGQCQCPQGKLLVDGACRTAGKAPPVIAIPTDTGGGDRGTIVPPPRSVSPQVPPSQPPAALAADDYVADQVMVTAQRAAPESVDDAIAQTHGLQLLERLSMTLLDARVIRYRIPDGRTVAAVLSALQADPRAGDPQANYLYRSGAGAAGIDSAQLQYALAKAEVTSAHLLAHGRDALVAVIDTGVDTAHPDLEAAVVQSFDAVGDGQGRPDAHGTAVAGIIRARGTIQGVAPQSRLLSVRAFTSQAQGRPAAATSFVLLRSLDWSVSQGARVLNLSFAGPPDPLFHRAVKAAYDRRTIIVAAAGNAGPAAPPAYPAAYEEVIAVTATDSADRLYSQANHGAYIAIAAPGVDILAPSVGRAHELRTGTSFAAAHVSGIIALMLERNPQLSPETARMALIAAASDLGPPGRDDEFGAGRANAYGSLRLLEQAKGPAGP